MTNVISTIETKVKAAGFATPIEILQATGIDYETFCDNIEKCDVRGLFRGARWGYISR